MKRERLTKQRVDALQVGTNDYVAWCGNLPGFGCRVRPSGAKSFIVQYRIGGRNSVVRKVTVGRYGKLTVEEARNEATKILAKAELGLDIAATRARQRSEMSISELCDEYLRDGCDHKKPSTLVSDRGRIERHIKPLLGRKRIGEVDRTEIEKFLRDVATGKTATDVKTKKHGRAIVKGGKGTATRTVRLLGGIFSYALARGYIDENPRQGVKLYKDGKGEKFLSSDELKRLGKALHEAETIGLPWQFDDALSTKHRPLNEMDRYTVISPYATAAIRLILLTGCRVGEILGLRWCDVDLENGFLNLLDSKTGAKKIVLAKPALEILASLPRLGRYVIAGATSNKPRSDIKRPWKRITYHAKLEGLRLHDLRHSFASVGAASGMGLSTVGKLLGHASPTTTARYSHFADDPLRRASEEIAGTISAMMLTSERELESGENVA